MIFLLRDILFGSCLFLFPILFFFKDTNLRQLSSNEIYLYVSTYFISYILLIFILLVLLVIFKLISKKKEYIFSNLVLIYLCFFSFEFILKVLVKLGMTKFVQVESLALIILFLFITFNLIIFNKVLVNYKLFFRIIFFYFLLNLVFNLFNNYQYFNSIEKIFVSANKIDILDKTNLRNNNIETNIYYVVLDGMISIENFSKYYEYNEKNEMELFKNLELKYIENSFSTYSTTHLTLASIFLMDFPVNESSERYTNRDNFFPSLIINNTSEIPLLNFLNNLKIDLYWIGNIWMRCLNEEKYPWICLNKYNSHNLIIIENLSNTVFQKTPFYKIKNYIFEKLDYARTSQRGMIDFMNYVNKFGINKKNKFVFIHHLSPHQPYEVDSNCEFKIYNDVQDGYKNSYLCVLNEVVQFTKFIKKIDPNSILIFQADHGQQSVNIIKNTKLSFIEEINLKSNIFNAILAPEKCFDEFGMPQTNINTIKFALNCAYQVKLEYNENIFYESFYENEKNYGIVKPYTHKKLLNIN